MNNRHWISIIFLSIIFCLALILRIYGLSIIPNGLHQDELNAGYQGYKILKTGMDLRGEFLPLYIDRFGDFRPGGIFYIDGISTILLGLNIFAIRFPSAFLGALTVIPVYLLGFAISKKKGIGLLAALFIAISPWHIVTSRATSEQVIALFLMIFGTYFLIKSLEEKNVYWMIGSASSLLFSYFFYHTPRLFVPVFLTVFVGLFMFHPLFKTLRRVTINKQSLLVLWITACLVTGGLSLTKSGIGRLSQTSIFNPQFSSDKIKSLSDTDQNVTVARVFHNKAVIYSKLFLDQYLSYFSMDFLFVKGGLPDRYVVPDMGLFYYAELPLMLIGFYFLLKRKDIFFIIPILWLLIGPLAASVTTEDVPNVERALFMLPGFQILEAYGLYYLYDLLGKNGRKLCVMIFTVVIALNMVYFLHQYFIHSPSYVSYRRDDGTQQLFENLNTREKDYGRIYLSSSQDLPLYYFYLHATSTKLAQYNQQTVNEGFTVGKYVFVNDECPERVVKIKDLKKSLIVDFGNCSAQANVHEIDRIYRHDGTTAYILKVTN